MTMNSTDTRPKTGWELDPNEYDHVLVMFSGGKDSLACILLLDLGVEREKIELWHHDIDGREGNSLSMDWAVTPAYCRAVAKALDLPIFFSWKVGGYEGEMLRENAGTNPIKFETPVGVKQGRQGKSKDSTRRKFPQTTANLLTRWCSAYLKIDVGRRAITNQERFVGKRVLVVTGERAEESASRAKYQTLEPHATDNRNGKRARRHVDHWRPVHGWLEEKVWEIIRRHRINPHPCYKLGWGRCSCQACIFGSPDQWATLKVIDPEKFAQVAAYEREFGVTIRRDENVEQAAEIGTAYKIMDESQIAVATSRGYVEPIIIEDWDLPAGAFGESDSRL